MSELGKYQLPKGWVWATIRDLSGKAGIFIDGDWVESKDQDPDGDVRLIQLADVGDGFYRDKSNRFMTKAKAEELGCTFLKGGDVLIARMPDPLGRACLFPGDAKPSVTVVDVAIVRSGNGEFDHRWLAYFVNAHPFRSAISALQAGSTRKRISRGNLATIPIPVPPLPEQRRIVAEIEKQFTRLEAGVSALKRVQANLKRYRAAVLKAACEGNLVPTESELAGRDRSYESGSELLTRILAERRKNWAGRSQYKEPAAPDTTNLPKLPKGWVYASIEQLGVVGEQAVLTGPFGTNLGRGDFTEKGVPILTISCLKETGINIEKADFVSEQKARELDRYRLKPGDLLFSRMASVGRAGIINEALMGILFNYHIMRLRLEPSVLLAKYYLAYIRGSVQVENYLREVNHGATRAGINTEQLLNMPVAVPPFGEQTRIVEEVERRLSVVDELDATVSANLKRAVRLRQAVLQKAFKAELNHDEQ